MASSGARRAGDVIAERYALEVLLGGGAYGEVWRARDAASAGAPVALKLLHAHVRNSRTNTRFLREAQLLTVLDHPGIARALDFRCDDALAYVALEYVDGETLHDWLARLTAPPSGPELASVLSIFRQLCAAVHHAHLASVVHRDLKPANIMIVGAPRDVRVKVLDFGVAKLLETPASGATTQGRLIGTEAYCAPEQLKSEAIDARTDVHALGVILFEMLTLRRPWLLDARGELLRFGQARDHGANETTEVLDRILRGPRPKLAALRPELPRALGDAIAAALSPRPAERPPSALALSERVHAATAAPAEASAAFPIAFGPYALLERIGRGGMGEVFLARPYAEDRGIPTPVVLKRLLSQHGERDEIVRRFEHEAQLAVSVSSRHVAKVFDVGEVGDELYIAMEHIDGWTFGQLIDALRARQSRLPLGVIMELVRGAVSGLAALHGAPAPIVHRDVAPKNLMIGLDGVVRVIDLGIGKANTREWKTQTGMILGSLGYIAPEQLEGRPADPRMDVWSMGASMFELLTLEPFIPRGSLEAMVRASLMTKPRAPSSVWPQVPRSVDALVERALATDPAARPPDARALLSELERAYPSRARADEVRASLQGLFAQRIRERSAELARLLALPLPPPPELEPGTRSFAIGPEVAPLEPRTRTVAALTAVLPSALEPPPAPEPPRVLATAPLTPAVLELPTDPKHRSTRRLVGVLLAVNAALGALVLLWPAREEPTITLPAPSAPPSTMAPSPTTPMAIVAAPTPSATAPSPTARASAPPAAPPRPRPSVSAASAPPSELAELRAALEAGRLDLARGTERVRAIARERTTDRAQLTRVEKCVLAANARSSPSALAACVALLEAIRR